MPSWIKGTTWFQFSCCAWGCQRALWKEGGKTRFRGWELRVSLWSEEPQNIHTLRGIPVKHLSRTEDDSSSVRDKVYIMTCKVLWEGEILWQENHCHPRGGFFCAFSPAGSCSPLCFFQFPSVNLRKEIMFCRRCLKETVLCCGSNLQGFLVAVQVQQENLTLV